MTRADALVLLPQVVAMLAKEPPVSPDADALRDEKAVAAPGVPAQAGGLLRGHHRHGPSHSAHWHVGAPRHSGPVPSEGAIR